MKPTTETVIDLVVLKLCNMKQVLVIFVVILASFRCNATKWQDIRSPANSPHFQEMFKDWFPDSKNSSQPTIEGRITNGLQASLGQFPHQVFMYLYESSGAGYLCGGSVIANFDNN